MFTKQINNNMDENAENILANDPEYTFPVIQLLIWGALFLTIIATIYSAKYALFIINLNSSVSSWPSTEATILKSCRNVRARKTGKKYDQVKSEFFPEVTYGYSVNEVDYTSEQLAIEKPFGSLSWSSREPLNEFLESFPKDGKLTIYYSPSNPDYSVIHKHPGSWGLFLALAIVCPLCWCGGFFFLAVKGFLGLRMKRFLDGQLPS